jgi:hypothetical protein
VVQFVSQTSDLLFQTLEMAEAFCTGTHVATKVCSTLFIGLMLMLAPVHVQVKQHISMARSRITKS